VVALLILAVLGEWLCVRREMQEIPTSQLRSRQAAGRQTAGMQLSQTLASTQRAKREVMQSLDEGSSLLRQADSQV
jgi:hypothetical protein